MAADDEADIARCCDKETHLALAWWRDNSEDAKRAVLAVVEAMTAFSGHPDLGAMRVAANFARLGMLYTQVLADKQRQSG
jgi:hypothetical protein